MRKTTRALAGALVAAVLTLGVTTQVTATGEDDGGYGAADAGAFGVTPDTTGLALCLADAGSLGLQDPVTACTK